MRRLAVLTVGGLFALTLHAAPVDFDGDPALAPETGIAATTVSLPVASSGAAWLQQLQTVGMETGETATRLLHTALGLIGVPYRRGGNSAETGFDCSGFVRYVYANTLGLVLPRRAAEQAQATTPIAKDELRPGDLVFFNTMRRAFSHVGVYLGDGKFIHSPSKGDHVKISDMNDRYWARRFNGARRVDAAAAPQPAVR
ncbi:C40 family peptidase [Tepidimonas taiwanensis]|uniref:Murein DD-endopeptidase MepH n=1 Tax=Tepidimonas taiwanensis TaxID=307486 RepID=A0A554WYY3_9BURK|nr:Murein DD-endopeptidase MepH [Tepidimonas taiwanensis]